jgi:hypothetical protein
MSQEIWTIIHNKESDIESIMQQWYDDDLEKVINYIYLILNKYNADIEDVLALYAIDPRHLEYLAGEPHEIFTLNAMLSDTDSHDLIDFVLDNHYLTPDTISYIIELLGYIHSYEAS